MIGRQLAASLMAKAGLMSEDKKVGPVAQRELNKTARLRRERRQKNKTAKKSRQRNRR